MPQYVLMVERTHSIRFSPLGPAEQLAGGSMLISASSFWMRFLLWSKGENFAFFFFSAFSAFSFSFSRFLSFFSFFFS